MRRVAVTKVSKQKSKPAFEYPYIRLPREYAPIVGEPATIFETEFEGRRAFLVVLTGEAEENTVEGSQGTVSGEQAPIEAKIDLIINLLSKMKGSIKGG